MIRYISTVHSSYITLVLFPGENKGIHVCLLCEYDAIPDLGHAAGHNLCSEASAAAALAIKRCIQDKKLGGKVNSVTQC